MVLRRVFRQQLQARGCPATECLANRGFGAVNPENTLAAARDRGVAVNAWTVTAQTVATDLADAGVDGLISDAPGYCRPG